ncbi:MAG: site-2 protease family protein [Chloroflexi bacterium]|nr:site-2 protease family protein [Chloroflexota bacterium]
MRGTIAVGRIFGIAIHIDLSWLFIVALITWSLSTRVFPDGYPGWGKNAYWATGLAGSGLLFVSILIHELAHSIMAKGLGHTVESITLFFLGGVSQIRNEAKSAGEEFRIAVVGPLTSFVLAGLFFLTQTLLGDSAEQLQALTKYLTFINLAVAIFNLIPAFPLDGGRVLRSLVWRATGSMVRANTAATTTGSLLGFGMIGLGVYLAMTASLFSGLWVIFIGWFIHSTAASSRSNYALRDALTGRRVRDAMRTDFPTVAPGMSIRQMIDQHALKDFEHAYVVKLGDTVQGIVTLGDLRQIPATEWAEHWISEVMVRRDRLVTVAPSDPLFAALRMIAEHDLNQVAVFEGDAMVGLLSRADVLRVAEIANAMGRR